jgi:hypothetical protein
MSATIQVVIPFAVRGVCGFPFLSFPLRRIRLLGNEKSRDYYCL